MSEKPPTILGTAKEALKLTPEMSLGGKIMTLFETALFAGSSVMAATTSVYSPGTFEKHAKLLLDSAHNRVTVHSIETTFR
jgi:hypothetical protein